MRRSRKRLTSRDENLVFAMKYRIDSYPRNMVFDRTGHLVYQLDGGTNAARFVTVMRRALDPAQQYRLAGVSPELELDSPAFLRTDLSGERQLARDTLSDYWEEHADWRDEVAWTVLYNGSSSTPMLPCSTKPAGSPRPNTRRSARSIPPAPAMHSNTPITRGNCSVKSAAEKQNPDFWQNYAP